MHMGFFSSAINILQTLVVAIGAGLGVRSKFYPRFIQADAKKPLKTRFFLDKLKWPK